LLGCSTEITNRKVVDHPEQSPGSTAKRSLNVARARNLKPGFFRNADLVELPFEARLMFAGLWTIADREGRMEDRPKQIKMEIFPADTIECDALLNMLQSAGMIERYSVENKSYIQVVNFTKHQNPHHMEAPSEIPPMDGTENKFNHSPISPKQRARIYARDGHECVMCGSADKLQIDHITMVAHGGTSDDDNLRTLCSQCNNKRSKAAKSEANPADSLNPIPSTLIPDSPNPENGIPSKDLSAPSAQTAKKTPLSLLTELGVDEQSAKDWLTVRKAKRAPLTQTALDELVCEAGKAGISVAQAVEICAKKSWQGFKASWNWNYAAPAAQQKFQTAGERRMAATDKAIAEWLGEDGKTVEGEVLNA
jgi:hypothetical protein